MNGAVAFAEAAKTLPRIGREFLHAGPPRDAAGVTRACDELVKRCQQLFAAEVCAIFLVRHGEAVLEAYRGYTHPYGTPIPFQTLREELRYKVNPSDAPEDGRFDGITGWVASTGNEFSADSWEEIKQHGCHAGKPDRIRIWDDSRPFRCMFAVPLKVHGKTLGVLKVENKRDPHRNDAKFDNVDKDLMRTLAHLFSMAIEDIYDAPEKATEFESALSPAAIDGSADLGALATRFDHCDMATVIERLPTHIEIALEQDIPRVSGGPFKRVVLTGLGGSALAADVVNDAFADALRVPISVSRSYSLPPCVDQETLVIASSFSGATEEVLHAIEPFPRSTRNLVVLSTGGPLTTLAQTRGCPVVHIPTRQEPTGFQPRSALGYTVTLLARLLHSVGLMDDPVDEIKAVPQFLRETDVRTDAQEVARWLLDKIPVVYTDESHLMSIARVAKVKFNENSKRPALFNALPEVNHNEMIGFTKSMAPFGVLYLHDPRSHPRIQLRFNVMKRVFERETLRNVAFWEWQVPGATNAQRVFAGLLFADQCSYTLALLDGLDPTPVALVESFKEILLEETKA